jgi:hypothetical protein
LIWYENDGFGSFSKHLIDNLSDSFYCLSTDIDNDGHIDIVASSYLLNAVYWYKNINGQGNFGYRNLITNTLTNGDSFDFIDIDNDNDQDVFISSSGNQTLIWVENINGLGLYGAPTIIAGQAMAINSVYAYDINNDNKKDIIASRAASDEVIWLENLDNMGNFSSENIISTQADFPRNISASDIDNDGDLDILSASHTDNKIAWYKNTNGLGAFGSQQIISNNAIGAHYVATGDLDNDGDLDVISASQNDHKIAWYKNNEILSISNFELSTLEIYPNPTTDVLNLKSSKPIDNLTILDIYGKKIMTEIHPKSKLSLKHLNAGLYFIQCTIGNQKTIRKIIKL